MGFDGVTRCSPHLPASLGIQQKRPNRLGDRVSVDWRHYHTRFSIAHGRADSTGIAGDRRNAGRSGFQKGDTESFDVYLLVYARSAEVDSRCRVSFRQLVVAHRPDESYFVGDTELAGDAAQPRLVVTFTYHYVAKNGEVASKIPTRAKPHALALRGTEPPHC